MADKEQKKTPAERYGSGTEEKRPKLSEEDKKQFKEWKKDYALARLRDQCKTRRR